jgi:hypothetical protein
VCLWADKQGRQRRGDVEVLIHWYNPMVVAQPPGGADRGMDPRGRPGTADSQGRAVRVSRDDPGRPPSGRRLHTSYAPETHDQSLRKVRKHPCSFGLQLLESYNSLKNALFVLA